MTQTTNKRRAEPASKPDELPPDLRRCELISSIYDNARRLGVSHEVAVMICAETQAEWAGQQAYIHKDAEDARRSASERNNKMRRDYQRGESVAFIARRYCLSWRQAYRIVAEPAV